MRCFHALFVVPLLFVSNLSAQSSNGYFFVAPGGATCCGYTEKMLHLGFGGEAVLAHGVGVGAELGALGSTSNYPDSVFGVFSPNGYFHFIHRRDRLDPFVTGGYTLFFRSGHANVFNWGGGFHYWFARHAGARFEFRDHVYSSGGTEHYWGIRIGLAIR
jgi:hypothetical protein